MPTGETGARRKWRNAKRKNEAQAVAKKDKQRKAGKAATVRKGGLADTARQLGILHPVSPSEAITGIMAQTAGTLAYCTMKVAELDEDEVFVGQENQRLNKWVRWLERTQDRLAKFAGMAVAMGVAEKQGALAEAQTQFIGKLMERVLGDLDLTPAQKKKLGPSIRKHTADIQGSATERTR
jgi:hypothetical protein